MLTGGARAFRATDLVRAYHQVAVFCGSSAYPLTPCLRSL